jgi:hypothetical protein
MEISSQASGLSNKPFSPEYFLSFVLSGMIFLLDMVTPLGFSVYIFYVIAVFLSSRVSPTSFSLKVVIVTSLLTIFGFFLSPEGDQLQLFRVIANRSLAVLVIFITGFLGVQLKLSEESQAKAISDREKSLEEIKILRGLLPICSLCKKIRDDKGYWKEIESYIRDHSEANFTHSICPKCTRILYPELFSKNGQSK